MRISKSLLSVSILLAANQAHGADIFNAKSMALAGSGLAVADYTYGALLNPALTSNYQNEDDFNFNLNVGANVRDEDELIDKATDLVDIFDAIENEALTLDRVNQIQASLEEIDNLTAAVEAGASALISIPNQYVSASLFINSNVAVGVTANYDENDIVRLQNSLGSEFDTDELKTAIYAQGIAISEVGINLSHQFKLLNQDITVGIAPKYQMINSISYLVNVSSFDEDDFDSDEYTIEDENFNLDVGIRTSFDQWHFGATIKNLLKNDYEKKVPYADVDNTVTIEPLMAIGAGFKNDWLQASIDLDINGVEDHISNENLQYLRAGLELDAYQWAQLRLGYRYDLKDNNGNFLTAGLGISPGDIINLDVALTVSEEDEVGGAIQLGFSF
jgi:hypothetical protein